MRKMTFLKRFALLLVGTGMASLGFSQSTVTLNFAHNQSASALAAAAGSDQLICPGDSIQIGSATQGGTTPYTYSWNPSTDLSSGTVNQPFASPLTTTTYTLTVTDANNCTSNDAVEVAIDTCVGVSQIAGLGKVTVFPNPNAGIFRIDMSLEKQLNNIEISITQVNGQQVYFRNISRPGLQIVEDVNLSAFSKGLYVVSVRLGDQVIMKNVVLQ